MRKLFIAIAASLIAGSTAGAQGAISVQGLGFPPGQISTRAEGSGGSIADFDPLSAVNPAAIGGVGVASVFLQYSPEFRRVTAGEASAGTTTARFPVFGSIYRLASWTLGFGSSTFLDRSFRNERLSAPGPCRTPDSVDVTERLRVLGAINDLRLVLAYSSSPRFRIGASAARVHRTQPRQARGGLS